MRRTQWTRVFGFAAAFGLVFTSGVYAQDIIQKVDAYLRPDYLIVADGKPVNLESSTLIYNGKSYLPLKEIGTVFGATINWNGENKTIYINTRVNEVQPETSDNVDYPEITMMGANGYPYVYLGSKTWMLKLFAKGGTYYRDLDVKRMGIDTNGLSKVREKYTEWLFINENELKKVWKETPKLSYDRDWTQMFMSTETDPEKLSTFDIYAKTWSQYTIGDQSHTIFPIVVDPIPNKPNEYRMLVTDNGHYFFYDLKLNERVGGGYNVNTAHTYNLEAGKKDPNDPYAQFIRY